MGLETRPNSHISLSLVLPLFCSEKHSGAIFLGRVEGQMICVCELTLMVGAEGSKQQAK